MLLGDVRKNHTVPCSSEMLLSCEQRACDTDRQGGSFAPTPRHHMLLTNREHMMVITTSCPLTRDQKTKDTSCESNAGGEKERMAGESKRVMKNITRVIDRHKHIDGYYVRLQWKGQTYAKLFSCQDDELEHHTLHRAIEWRNQTETRIGKPRTERRICGITRVTNTGEKGIRWMEVQQVKDGKPVGRKMPWYVITAFDHQGRRHRTKISIEKYGIQRAFVLARQQYQKWNALFTSHGARMMCRQGEFVFASL